MNGSESRATKCTLAGLAVVWGLAFAASAADARSIVVRWRYPAPERVTGFRVHLGSAPGEYTRTIDVGRPVPDPEGIYRVTVEVADDEPTYLSVTAYGDGGEESPRSNETMRAPEPAAEAGGSLRLGTPGQPRVVGQ